MTLEERAACIADKCLISPRCRADLRAKVYAESLKMLREAAMCQDCGREVSEAELLETLKQ